MASREKKKRFRMRIYAVAVLLSPFSLQAISELIVNLIIYCGLQTFSYYNSLHRGHSTHSKLSLSPAHFTVN
jgi:hypothetical protein